MSERRQKAVSNLFNSMDVNKDGQLTILDLKVNHVSLSFIKQTSIFQTKYASQLKDNTKKSDKVNC